MSPSDASRGRIRYQPALDGLRGVAVAAVLVYHAGFGWAAGGFLGVDAFFVLSGYLITGLLIAEWRDSGTVDLRAFWARRVRRLLPALLLMLGGVVVYAVVFAHAAELSRIRSDAIATLAYVANWHAVFSGNSYFEQFSVPSPLQHTWSLAVEEQWYALWPLAVGLLMRARRGSLAPLTVACLVLALASAALMAMLYRPGADPSRVYYGTDTRAQSLLVGAFVACVLAEGPAWARSHHTALTQAAGVIAIALTAWLWLTLRSDTAWLYRGGFLALALLVGTIIAAITRTGPLGSAFSLPPLRALGRISYGVYLWHWPLYLVLTPDRTGLGTVTLFAARVSATIVVAGLSYVIVETPIRRQSWRGWRSPHHAWVALPAAAAIVALLVFVVTQGGAPARAIATGRGHEMPHTQLAADATGPARVLVVGDSVAYTLVEGLSRAEGSANISVWNQAKIGCGVLRGDAAFIDGRWTQVNPDCDWAERWRSYVDAFQPDAVVVLAGAWDLYDRKVSGETLRFDTPAADAFATSEIRAAADVLSADGAKVYFLTTPDYRPRDLGLAGDEPRFDPARIARLNALYREVAATRADNVGVLDLASFVRANGDVGKLTSDGVHFTPAGADAVASWLGPTIAQRTPIHVQRSHTPGQTVALDGAPNAHWRDLLSLVPASDVPASVVMNDYARFRALFGITLPAASDPGATNTYARAMLFDSDGRRTALVPSEASGLDSFPPHPDQAIGTGVSITEIEQDVVSGGTQILERSFGTGTAPAYARGAPSAGRSLADDPTFTILADALEREGTYTAAISTDTTPFSLSAESHSVAGPDAGQAARDAAARDLERTGVLERFGAYATGAGIDASGAFTVVVLLNPSDDIAQTNATRLRERLSSGSSSLASQQFGAMFTAADVRADGRLVVATLRGGSAAYWYGLFAAADALPVWR